MVAWKRNCYSYEVLNTVHIITCLRNVLQIRSRLTYTRDEFFFLATGVLDQQPETMPILPRAMLSPPDNVDESSLLSIYSCCVVSFVTVKGS